MLSRTSSARMFSPNRNSTREPAEEAGYAPECTGESGRLPGRVVWLASTTGGSSEDARRFYSRTEYIFSVFLFVCLELAAFVCAFGSRFVFSFFFAFVYKNWLLQFGFWKAFAVWIVCITVVPVDGRQLLSKPIRTAISIGRSDEIRLANRCRNRRLLVIESSSV